MDILKVKITRRNNSTTREILATELPVLEEIFPGGESDGDVEVIGQRKATKEDMTRFLQRPQMPGVEEETSIPDVELAFMNMSARYDSKEGQAALKAIYPSLNSFRRAFKGNGAEKPAVA